MSYGDLEVFERIDSRLIGIFIILCLILILILSSFVSSTDLPKCEKLTDGNIKVFYSFEGKPEKSVITYSKMFIKVLKKEEVYRDLNFSVYYESEPFACKGIIKEKRQDFRVVIKELGQHSGYEGLAAQGSKDRAGYMILSSSKKINKYLIMHEVGHLFGLNHSGLRGKQGNYMSTQGSKDRYNAEQVEQIKAILG